MSAPARINHPHRNWLAWLPGFLIGPLTGIVAANTSPILAAIGAVGALVSFFMILYPFFGFLLTSAVIPIERIGRLTNDSSVFTFSIMRILGAINLVAVLVHAALSRTKPRWSLPLTLYGVYLIFGILTLTHTTDFEFGFRAAGTALGNLAFLFVVLNLARQRLQVWLALTAWLATTTIVGGFTVYQWHAGSQHITEDRFNSTGQRSTSDRFETVMEDASEYEESTAMPRALGPTSHPAVYAINNILVIPFLVVAARFLSNRWLRAASALALCLACYNVVLTNTRAALLTMAAALVLCPLTGLYRPGWKALVGLGVVVLAALPLVPKPVWERVLNLENYETAKSATLSARMRYWKTGLEVIRENPIWGIGLGHQTEIPRRMRRYLNMPDNSTVHNEYIQDLMEVGIVGYPFLVAFVAVLYGRIRRAERRFKVRRDLESAAVLTAAKVALLSVLIYGVQVDVLHFPLKGWWLAMGLALVLDQIAAIEMRNETSTLPFVETSHGSA